MEGNGESLIFKNNCLNGKKQNISPENLLFYMYSDIYVKNK